MVGAEFDMLSNEARQTFPTSLAWTSGRERMGCTNSRRIHTSGLSREMSGMASHTMMDGRGKDAETMRLRRTQEMIEQVGEWLFKGPFARR